METEVTVEGIADQIRTATATYEQINEAVVPSSDWEEPWGRVYDTPSIQWLADIEDAVDAAL